MNNIDPLIRTKLRLPFTRPGLVVRPRLQERIAHGLCGPLTLIMAPAGYGKTTLVASCIARCGMPTWFRSAMLLPWSFSNLAKALLAMAVRRNPAILFSMGGTVALTSVGMFGGSRSGWGLTPTGSSLGLVVGGIAWKPAVIEGRIEPREILNLTLVFDHDVIDGAPAARFARRLVDLIESGYGLDEMGGG